MKNKALKIILSLIWINIQASTAGLPNNNPIFTDTSDAISEVILEEYTIGETVYDLQSNFSMQNRVYLFPNGEIGATFTFGLNYPGFPGRGTGYNFYDGSIWEPAPIERIEQYRAGWPSYTGWGSDGEIVVAHYFGSTDDGLVINSRENRGTGDWNEVNYFGPSSSSGLYWPRSAAGGVDNQDIHILAITKPVESGGSLYQGLDGAILYSQTSDGGLTWSYQDVLIEGITSSDYLGFNADTYEIAAKNNSVAILIGNTWTDLIMMKSIDNGATWTKTVVWEHPYPFFDPSNPIATDTFYCVDGAHSLAFDNTGTVHVAFGINRAVSDNASTYLFPLVDGVGYWNENMSTFSNNVNALSPYGDTGSELVEDFNLIGWMQDVNGNGILDILGEPGTYFLGASSMPQLVIDELNQIFLFYSSITETYNNGEQDYRHIWARGSADNGSTWGNFIDLNYDLVYIFSECVFPSCSPSSNGYVHLVFQEDSEPGLAVRGDEDPYGPNNMIYSKILKSDIVTPTETGELVGYVTETGTGNPIDGATILINGTFYSASSQADGSYSIENIPIGNFDVTCSKNGYTTQVENIEINVGNVTNQDFVLTTFNLLPPVNLEYELIDDDLVLSWETPEDSKSLLGYNVYMNGGFDGFTSSTSYIIFDLLPGTYEFYVTAVYDEGESEPSNTITVNIEEEILPPYGLQGQVSDNDIFLSWFSPAASSWIQWDSGENNGNAVGLTSGGTFYGASRWLPEELIPYDGLQISKISFFPYSNSAAIFVIKIWTGIQASTLVHSQIVEDYVVGEFNEVTLTNPVVIDASQELWFGYEVTHEDGYNPAGCDDGPAIAFKGDMIKTGGNNWLSMATEYGIDYNWNLAAEITNGEKTEVLSVPSRKEKEIPIESGNTLISAFDAKIVASKKKVFEEIKSKELLGFNLYRNNSLLTYTTQAEYWDYNLEPGTYSYFVTSVYDGGESEPSDTVIISSPQNCDQPLGINVYVVNGNYIEVNVVPPASGYYSGFNIYNEGNLVATTSSTTYSFSEPLPPGVYEYCVSTVCASGESETICDTAQVFAQLPSPEALEVQVLGENIIVSWEEPNEDVLDYTIFYKFTLVGTYSVIGFTTQTSYVDPGMANVFGEHFYAIVANYNNGSSNPAEVSVVITNIEKYDLPEVDLFPNPANDWVKITASEKIKSIELINDIGEGGRKFIINEKSGSINTSSLSGGVYMVRIQFEDEIVFRKLILL